MTQHTNGLRDVYQQALSTDFIRDDKGARAYFERVFNRSTSPGYQEQRKSAEQELLKALGSDVNELSFGQGQIRHTMLRNTRRVADTHWRPLLEVYTDADTASEIVKSPIVHGMVRNNYMSVDADGVFNGNGNPSVLYSGALTVSGIKQTDRVKELLKTMRDTEGNIDVFLTGEAALEAAKLMLTTTEASEAFVFESLPTAVLPEAYYADPEVFQQEMGFLSAYMPKSRHSALATASFVGALIEASQRMKLHYSWNHTVSAKMLALSYQSAPGIHRYAYLKKAEQILSSILQSPMGIGYYTPSESPRRSYEVNDWRDILFLILDKQLMFGFTGAENFYLEGGINVPSSDFSSIVKDVARDYKSSQSIHASRKPREPEEKPLVLFGGLGNILAEQPVIEVGANESKALTKIRKSIKV